MFFILYNKSVSSTHWMMTWIAFCVCHLFFSWFTILTCRPTDQPDVATKQDAGRALTFVFILFSTVASLLAVILLFRSTKDLKGGDLVLHILLTLAAVFCSWWLLHTNFALKYAHLYHIERDFKNAEKHGGLDFPGQQVPEYMDFIYFSFVIGTTFQVSDVAVLSRKIRTIVFLHSVLSFCFNTGIVALTINIVSGMIK